MYWTKFNIARQSGYLGSAKPYHCCAQGSIPIRHVGWLCLTIRQGDFSLVSDILCCFLHKHIPHISMEDGAVCTVWVIMVVRVGTFTRIHSGKHRRKNIDHMLNIKFVVNNRNFSHVHKYVPFLLCWTKQASWWHGNLETLFNFLQLVWSTVAAWLEWFCYLSMAWLCTVMDPWNKYQRYLTMLYQIQIFFKVHYYCHVNIFWGKTTSKTFLFAYNMYFANVVQTCSSVYLFVYLK